MFITYIEMMVDILKYVVQISLQAGKATLEFYGRNMEVEKKEDNSPITEADKLSNSILINGLQRYNLPVLSEESDKVGYETRKKWDEYWLIDPLDGTKEFIRKSDEYTINVALIKGTFPVMGVVYAPAKDLLFYGQAGYGSFKVENASEVNLAGCFSETIRRKLPVGHSNPIPVVVASKSHMNQETEHFIQQIRQYYSTIQTEHYGSSLKLCMIAEGSADIYPRMGPTMEWDTAASQAIVEAVGYSVIQYPGGSRMSYNKENLLNPFFIVYNNHIEKAVNELFTAF
jgi:3'(2'), 5'-bisphosphate nucleotidase